MMMSSHHAARSSALSAELIWAETTRVCDVTAGGPAGRRRRRCALAAAFFN